MIIKQGKKKAVQTKYEIAETSVTKMPWQSKPLGCDDIMWRDKSNPIITGKDVKCANSIYNSAVLPYNGSYVGIFRVDHKDRIPHLHLGWSKDAKKWDIEEKPINFICDTPEISNGRYAYDPRLCKIGDFYFITWCTDYHGPTIGVAYTENFKEFIQLENAFLPYNRNGVLFPRKVNGNYAMLSRPSDAGHTNFGNIFYSESPDTRFWGNHRFVLGRGGQWWQQTKVGAGSVPIETDQGWVIFYHGVMESCNGFVYSIGAALLDIEKPWKVLYRTNKYILTPEKDYEVSGNVPNVVFPCAAVYDRPTGRIAVYYGAADSCCCIAYTTMDELLSFLKENSQVF